MDQNESEIKINLDELVPNEESVFDPKIVAEVEATETPPAFNSEEWHEYVMRQFMENELDNGNPIRDGLVRVAEKLIGPIAKREVLNFQAGNDDGRFHSTVHIRLTLALKNESHPLYGSYPELIEDGIAETNHRNSQGPYHLHPSATSASKAEAQALRKALRLRRTIAADEATPEDLIEEETFIPEKNIVPEQITVIDVLCKRLNISVLDFISSGEVKYAHIEQITNTKAQKMIKFLNDIQSGKQQSPVNRTYDPAWRDKNAKRSINESSTESRS